MTKKASLSKFESLAQSLIEGSLGRLLGGSVTPADIAARLTRVMEDSRLNNVVADSYYIRLHPTDFAPLLEMYPQLAQDLESLVFNLAYEANLVLRAEPKVTIQADTAVKRLEIAIQAVRQQRLPETTQLRPENAGPNEQLLAIAELDAYLVIDGRHHLPLNKPIINLGRRTDNDIVLDAATVSRRHAQIRWRYGRFVLYDLSSRNGRTQVNGQPVHECVLQAGDVVTLSEVKLLYAEGQTVLNRGQRQSADQTQVMPTEEQNHDE